MPTRLARWTRTPKDTQAGVKLALRFRLHQFKDATFGELVGLHVHASLHESVGIELGAASREFCHCQLKWNYAVESLVALLQIGIAKYQIVLHKTAGRVLAQQRVYRLRSCQK